MPKPFIYIAALRRTGSTLLCEVLSAMPHGFVFNEPNLADGSFVVREREYQFFREQGVDLRAFRDRRSGLRRPFLFRAFQRELLPRLLQVVEQVGVKEIFHRNWRRYLKAFPDMKVVLTARDPRDVYISLYNRYRRGVALWEGPFGPREVAESLLAEFEHQRAMEATLPVEKVRYEDLCSDQSSLARVRRFTESDVSELGEIGSVLSRDPRRQQEHAVHGGRITGRQIARWRREEDMDLVRDAKECFERMGAYVEYWGYE